METSGNLKDFDKLYLIVCKVLKQYENMNVSVPTKETFYLTFKKFNELIKDHKSILTAIGKL